MPLQVALVAAENDIGALAVSVALELLDPVLDFQEGAFVGSGGRGGEIRKRIVERLEERDLQVKDQKETHGVPVEGGREAAETFLASCVPELQVETVVSATGGVDLGGERGNGEKSLVDSSTRRSHYGRVLAVN